MNRITVHYISKSKAQTDEEIYDEHYKLLNYVRTHYPEYLTEVKIKRPKAGRGRPIINSDVNEFIRLRKRGWSYKAIAKVSNCSVAHVYRKMPSEFRGFRTDDAEKRAKLIVERIKDLSKRIEEQKILDAVKFTVELGEKE